MCRVAWWAKERSSSWEAGSKAGKLSSLFDGMCDDGHTETKRAPAAASKQRAKLNLRSLDNVRVENGPLYCVRASLQREAYCRACDLWCQSVPFIQVDAKFSPPVLFSLVHAAKFRLEPVPQLSTEPRSCYGHR